MKRWVGPTMATLALWLAACAGDSTSLTTPAASSPATTTSSAPTSSSEEPISDKDFDPTNFDETSTTVDNEWFPLVPGTQLTWDGQALDGEEKVERRVVFTVTDLVKEVDGIRVVVGWDLDYNDGVLEEGEIALFAQDVEGNVWHFGQYPEEYDDGKIVKAPAWIAGYHGARPGIAMKADPELGTPSYAQGWGPQVGWNDRARTYQVGEHTCVPVDCYDDVLVTQEFSRTEPGAYQLKYYAAGVGNVRVGWGGPNEDEHEVLVLTELMHLDPAALAEVREKVLAQEKRAYRISPDVYGKTAPAEQVPAA
jgi:hypothetical protein